MTLLLPVLARVVVGFVAGLAGVLKLLNRSDATTSLSALFGGPRSLVRAGALALAVAEVLLGIALVSGAFLATALPLAALLFAIFGVSVLILLRRGKAGASCGCLGKRGRLSATLAAQDFGLSLLACSGWLGVEHPIFFVLLLGGSMLFLMPLARHLLSGRTRRGPVRQAA